MTPKEKAYQIYDKIANVTDGLNKYPMCYDTAKQCALIVVDEIIKTLDTEGFEYWNEVKEEIEKI
jgi:hypothetical protein